MQKGCSCLEQRTPPAPQAKSLACDYSCYTTPRMFVTSLLVERQRESPRCQTLPLYTPLLSHNLRKHIAVSANAWHNRKSASRKLRASHVCHRMGCCTSLRRTTAKKLPLTNGSGCQGSGPSRFFNRKRRCKGVNASGRHLLPCVN